MIKTFAEFLDSEFNEVYDFIAENIRYAEPESKVQPWPDFKHTHLEIFKRFYDSHVLPHIHHIQEPFSQLVHSQHKTGYKTLVGLKPIVSLHDKIMFRGKELSHINDVIRGAVLTRNKYQAKDVVDNIKNQANVIEHDYKKLAGFDTGYGGAHHLVVDMNGVKAEIQVMPKKIWKAHQETHRIYNKYRNLEHPELHPDYKADTKYSRHLFKKAYKAWVRKYDKD